MNVNVKIELSKLDSDFDEDVFLDALKHFLGNNEQTWFAEGEITVKSDRHTLKSIFDVN